MHIGKSSAGWKFLFNGRFKSKESWFLMMKISDKIVDEYGDNITIDEMDELIERKQKLQSHTGDSNFYFSTVNGYEFFDVDFT